MWVHFCNDGCLRFLFGSLHHAKYSREVAVDGPRKVLWILSTLQIFMDRDGISSSKNSGAFIFNLQKWIMTMQRFFVSLQRLPEHYFCSYNNNKILYWCIYTSTFLTSLCNPTIFLSKLQQKHQNISAAWNSCPLQWGEIGWESIWLMFCIDYKKALWIH